MSRDLEWFGRGKAFDSCFLVWGGPDGLIKLTVTIVGSIQRCEGYQLLWERRKVRGMLLVLARSVAGKFQLIRSSGKCANNAPWTRKWMHEFVDLATLAVGTGGAASKHDVAGQKDSWIASARVNELGMPTPMLSDKEIRDFAAGRETCCKVARI